MGAPPRPTMTSPDATDRRVRPRRAAAALAVAFGALAVAALAAAPRADRAGSAAAALPGSGLVPPDSLALYLLPHGEGYTLLQDAGTKGLDSATVSIVLDERLTWYLEKTESFYSRGADGDILLHGSIDHRTRREVSYDPPVVLVDFPLDVGKSWRVHSRRVADTDPLDGGLVIDQVRSIDSADTVVTHMKRFPAVFIGETITAGPPLGEMWYSPVAGCVARRDSTAAPWQLWEAAGRELRGLLPGLGEPVDLRFDWPVGRRLRIERTTRNVRLDGRSADSLTEVMTVAVEAVGDGRRLTLGFPPDAMEAGSPASPRLRELIARYNDAGLAMVVDAAGQLVRLENVGPSRAALFDLMRERRRSHGLPEVTAAADSALRAVLTDSLYAMSLRAAWGEMLGLWLACADSTGRITTLEMPPAPTMIPGVPIGATGLCATLGRRPCPGETTAELGCVALAAGFEVREPLIGPLLERWLDDISLDPAVSDTSLADVAVRIDAGAVLDPGTALPRTVQFLKHLTMGFIAPGSAPIDARELEYTEYKFTLIDER